MSLLDVTLVSSSCAFLCTSKVKSEFLGSDHSVVLTAVKANTTPEDQGVPKWNFSKADWQKFSAACNQTLGSFSISLDYAYCLFETSVREAYLEAISQSKRFIKITVPWWNKQCDIAVKNKKHAFNRMKRTWHLRDIIIFKRCGAKARRVILEAQSSSWRQFCTSLTSTQSHVKGCWPPRTILMGTFNISKHLGRCVLFRSSCILAPLAELLQNLTKLN